MGSDAPPERDMTPGGFSVSLYFDDLEEGRRAFDALAEGGTVKMALQEDFLGEGLRHADRPLRHPWIVNCGHAGGQGASRCGAALPGPGWLVIRAMKNPLRSAGAATGSPWCG